MDYYDLLKKEQDFLSSPTVEPEMEDDFVIDTGSTLKKDDLKKYQYLQPIRDYMIERKGVDYKSIADDEVGKGIVGYNPIIAGQLTKEEIELSTQDSLRPLMLRVNEINVKESEKKSKKYIPLSKRQDKPDSALWLIKNHNILKDSQIAKLVGITKNSVTSIRNKSYWNYNNLNSKDPVALNLFSQKDLVAAIEKAERRIKREKKEKEKLNKTK